MFSLHVKSPPVLERGIKWFYQTEQIHYIPVFHSDASMGNRSAQQPYSSPFPYPYNSSGF